MRTKRKVDVLVLSDIHLGTFGCKALELLSYLKTVDPDILVLNGDIFDIWQFNKRYFPKSHMQVVLYFTSLLSKGTRVYYVTGNHDEMLRKFKGFRLGSFEIVNKVVLDLNGAKAWIFHGDVFDVSMKHSKWLAKLGGLGYDLLIMINTFVNWVSKSLGRGRFSFAKRIKRLVKDAVKHINNFEETAAEIAISNGYDYVICGHIHQPQIRKITNKEGRQTTYLNSGDWVENLTALEYVDGEWSIYDYFSDPEVLLNREEHHPEDEYLLKAGYKQKELFNEMMEEFQIAMVADGLDR